MVQANKRIQLKIESKGITDIEQQEALKELARLMVEAGHQWITQMEYDLTADKAHNVQFFIRHWGSWAQAVEQAKSFIDLQKDFAPKPSPYAAYVQCLCGKALHCQERFWSPDRRRIRMCDACRAWSDGITVDEGLLYLTDDSTTGRNASLKSQRNQQSQKTKPKEIQADPSLPLETQSKLFKNAGRPPKATSERVETIKRFARNG